MPSTKQEALADLMHWLICLSRGPQSYGPFRRLFRKRHYERVLDHLYLIHKIPLSILDPDFTGNDIDFINWGMSPYVDKVGREIDSRTASNLIAVFDSVPEALHHEVQWSPPDWLREIARKGEDSHSNLEDQLAKVTSLESERDRADAANKTSGKK